MNNQVAKLYQLAGKRERTIIGLMSGTSVDGLDIALCRISGSGATTQLHLDFFTTITYEKEYREAIASVFSKREVDLEKVCLLNGWIARQHGAMILQSLKEWKQEPSTIDCIASHGQTIYHAPKLLHRQRQFDNATLQIGDGDHLAVHTGIITISDFRQKHIAAGGEGAPLAAYGDYFLFSKKNENRILLNIGGIANFTFLPGSLDATAVFSTDTGPGNTLMDAWAQQQFGKSYDADGAIAATGTVSEKLLTALKDHPFFTQGLPKTTGPELFNLSYLQAAKERSGATTISAEDTMATLNRFSADTIAACIKEVINNAKDYTFYASGGGMHNPVLMKNLSALLPGFEFFDTGQLGINPDAKEAVLFALLANETLSGNAPGFGEARNGIPNVSMGKISFPR